MLHPLKIKRSEKGWSQHHIAYSTGVAQYRISYAERWYPALTEKQKERISELFGLTKDELFPSVNAPGRVNQVLKKGGKR